MKRIGIIAGRIAKDDLVAYNGLVLLLSFLLSLFVFLLAAFLILAGMALTSYMTQGHVQMDAGDGFFRLAAAGLMLIVGLVNGAAVIINIKLTR